MIPGYIDKNRIPRHIAVIMDGNGRWARKKGYKRVFGHRQGTKATREVVRACGEIGVEVLTIYVFSSENWKRPKTEVNALMMLLEEMVKLEVPELNKNNVKMAAIGDTGLLPEKTRNVLMKGIDDTSGNTGLVLNLAISYGGRKEIVSAAVKAAKRVSSGELSVADLNETVFSEGLYTAGYPDPELLIRTGGEFRISNFLLWQAAYSEIVITETLWPDFGREELFSAIKDYQSRERRFGGIRED
ncbi:MAG: isoprenyl transferase [Fibrobacterota bacterium]